MLLNTNLEKDNSSSFKNDSSFSRTVKNFIDSVKSQNEAFKNRNDIYGPLNRITMLVATCKTYNCLSAASEVSKYLSSNSDVVRSRATLALDFILYIVNIAIAKEQDPEIKQNLIKEVSGLISLVKDKSTNGDVNKSLSLINYDLNKTNGVGNMGDEIKFSNSLLNSFGKQPQTNNDSKEELSAISKINKLTSSPKDLSSCIKAIKELMQLLSSGNEHIKKYASEQICKLIKLTADLLKKETDPGRIQQYGKALLEICTDIKSMSQSGGVNLSASSKSNINEALAIIKEKLCSNHKKDSFTSLNNENERTPWDKNIKKSIENLYGSRTERFPIQA